MLATAPSQSGQAYVLLVSVEAQRLENVLIICSCLAKTMVAMESVDTTLPL